MPRRSEQSSCTSLSQTSEPRGTRWDLAIPAHVSPNLAVYLLLVRHSSATRSVLRDVALLCVKIERTEMRRTADIMTMVVTGHFYSPDEFFVLWAMAGGTVAPFM